jgi:hypothetical protein
MPPHMNNIVLKLISDYSTIMVREICIINFSKPSKLVHIKLGERILWIKAREAYQ